MTDISNTEVLKSNTEVLKSKLAELDANSANLDTVMNNITNKISRGEDTEEETLALGRCLVTRLANTADVMNMAMDSASLAQDIIQKTVESTLSTDRTTVLVCKTAIEIDDAIKYVHDIKTLCNLTDNMIIKLTDILYYITEQEKEMTENSKRILDVAKNVGKNAEEYIAANMES